MTVSPRAERALVVHVVVVATIPLGCVGTTACPPWCCRLPGRERKQPFRVVERLVRTYKGAIENRLNVGKAKAA